MLSPTTTEVRRSERGSLTCSSLDRNAMVRVLIVDDHPVVREGVALILSAQTIMSIIGCASSAKEAVHAARDTQPDIVLLDLRLPDGLGLDVIDELRAVAPRAKIVLFTAHAEHAGVRAAVEKSLDGCLLKDATGADLADTLLRVAAGEKVFDPRIAQTVTGQVRERLWQFGLTLREYETVRLVAVGKTNAEIALALGLAPNTVKSYLQRAMDKLGARNRVEVINRAHDAGLF